MLRGVAAAAVMPLCFTALFLFPNHRTRLGLLVALFFLAAQVTAPGALAAGLCLIGGGLATAWSAAVARYCPGTWQYAQPRVAGAPLWLVPLWACGFLAIRAFLMAPVEAGACSLRLTLECDRRAGLGDRPSGISASLTA